jgi:hypothetical protein
VDGQTVCEARARQWHVVDIHMHMYARENTRTRTRIGWSMPDQRAAYLGAICTNMWEIDGTYRAGETHVGVQGNEVLERQSVISAKEKFRICACDEILACMHLCIILLVCVHV